MTTPRRSTRATSHLSADDPVPVVGKNTPTARGAGRASIAPSTGGRSPAKKKQDRELPPLPSKISNAYGGAGKADLAEGLQLHGGETDFAQVFEERRKEAYEQSKHDRDARAENRGSRESSQALTEVPSKKPRGQARRKTVETLEEVIEGSGNAREIDVDEGAAARRASKGKARAPNPQRMIEHYELSPDEMQRLDIPDKTSLLNVEIDNDYGYENQAAQGVNFARPVQVVRPVVNDDDGQQTWQNSVYELLPPWKLFLSWVTGALVLAMLVTLLSRSGSPKESKSSASSFSPVERMKTTVLSWASRISNPNHESDPWDLRYAVQQLDNQLKTLTSSSTLHDDSIRELQHILPDTLVVPKKNGQYQIPESFWQALRNKMSKDPEAIVWETFLAKNEAQLRAFTDGEMQANLNAILKDKGIVSADIFTDMIRENFDNLSRDVAALTSHFESRITNIEALASENALRAAKTAIREQIDRMGTMQISNLAMVNILRNADIALRSVNFFSPNLGATVDPYLTSSTQIKPVSSGTKFVKRIFGTTHKPNPPIAALESWQEAGDCWCAAPPAERPRKSGDRTVPKAQLGVLMSRAVYPDRITIEHVPSSGSLDIETAPRTMELWVSIMDPKAREEVVRAAAVLHNINLPSHEKERSYVEYVPETNADRMMGIALDDSYVKIGEWTYDFHELNHVQTFDLDVRMKDFGVPVKKAVVRATSNWGAGWTCLYRVRLHGEIEKKEMQS